MISTPEKEYTFWSCIQPKSVVEVTELAKKEFILLLLELIFLDHCSTYSTEIFT